VARWGLGPPAVLDEAGFLVGRVLRSPNRCRLADAGEVDALTPVVLATLVRLATVIMIAGEGMGYGGCSVPGRWRSARRAEPARLW